VGYLRADYRTAENVEGWSVNGGLRYQFVPDPAVRGSEPLIAKAPIDKAAPAQAAYNWTGLYIGPYLGADWGYTNWTFTDDGGTTSPRFAGLLGRGEIGYNYEAGKWVFGIGGDGGVTNARGARPCPTGFFYNCEINTNWLATATARVGYASWDRLLVYAKGGAVIAQDQAESWPPLRIAFAGRSTSRGGKEPDSGNSALPPTSPGYGASKVSALKPVISSRQSTTGLPRVSTRRFSRTQRRC
jgi:opacity protein-like surface antigen